MQETTEQGMVEQVRAGMAALSRRIGMLHLAYARTLVDALGEEQGRALIEQAIAAYGGMVGEATRQHVEARGLETSPENFKHGSDLSPLGFDQRSAQVDGEARIQVYGCEIAEVWLEAGENELGYLYCGVDPAKMNAYHPDWTMVHTRSVLRGDPFCEHAVRRVDEA